MSPWLVSLPLAVAVAESVLPFLFPWNLAVTVWRAWPLLQVAELGGAPAVSALVVLINLTLLEAGLALRTGVPSLGRYEWRGRGGAHGGGRRNRLRAAHVAAARQAAPPKVRVGIVQPNSGTVTAEASGAPGQQYLATLRQATHELARGGAELVVWPESAFPFLFDRQLNREYAPGHPWELRPGFSGRSSARSVTPSVAHSSTTAPSWPRRTAASPDCPTNAGSSPSGRARAFC